jgi:hypothetical protein
VLALLGIATAGCAGLYVGTDVLPTPDGAIVDGGSDGGTPFPVPDCSAPSAVCDDFERNEVAGPVWNNGSESGGARREISTENGNRFLRLTFPAMGAPDQSSAWLSRPLKNPEEFAFTMRVRRRITTSTKAIQFLKLRSQSSLIRVFINVAAVELFVTGQPQVVRVPFVRGEWVVFSGNLVFGRNNTVVVRMSANGIMDEKTLPFAPLPTEAPELVLGSLSETGPDSENTIDVDDVSWVAK